MTDTMSVCLLAVCLLLNSGVSYGELGSQTCQIFPKASEEDPEKITEVTMTACSLDELRSFPDLETAHVHHLEGKLQFSSKMSTLTTLSVQGGSLELDPELSKTLPNLKSLSLEEVEIKKLQKSTFSSFARLDHLSFVNSNFRRTESGAIKLQMTENSAFAISNSTFEHLFGNAVDVEAAVVHFQNSVIHLANSRSFRLRTKALVFTGNTVEHAEADVLEVLAPKLQIDNNRFKFVNSSVLSSVSLTPSDESYFSVKNNTFDSQTSVDVDFRQLNIFNESHLNAVLVIEGNTLPCTCKLPFANDSSTRFVEHSRNVFYRKIHETSYCLHSSVELRSFLLQECRGVSEENGLFDLDSVPVIEIDPQEEYDIQDYPTDENTTVVPESEENEYVNVGRSAGSVVSNDKSSGPKLAENVDRDTSKDGEKDSLSSDDNNTIIGAIVLVVTALLILLCICVPLFCMKALKKPLKEREAQIANQASEKVV